MTTILIAEDDTDIGNILEHTLTNEGYSTLRAYSGTEALMIVKDKKPSLILLDMMLPGLTGDKLLPKVGDIPVIVLSALSDTETKVRMLKGGAYDYITKPYDTDELLARIAVALRNAVHKGRGVISCHGIELDTDTHKVTLNGAEIHLTRTEYAILKLLMQNDGQVVSKLSILDRISDDTPDCTESSLKQHISNLRRKLRAYDDTDHIEAVWGIGFKVR
ncbi:MAG: response regulator transcription factor [Ruminococcus sp.]|nr:response regulator transcription factor [Ruminococcus sp.]MBR1751073.1 response regulator transcription factor [Ruminococcus sp.]